MPLRDISDILRPTDQTLGGAFGIKPNLLRIGGNLEQQMGFDVPRPPAPNFSEVPDISNMLKEQGGDQIIDNAVTPGIEGLLDPGQTSDLGDFQDARDFWRETGSWPDTDAADSFPGVGSFPGVDIERRGEDLGTGVGPGGFGKPVDVPDVTISPPVGMPDDTQPGPDIDPDPFELQEFTFAGAATPPPEYISPELKALPEFGGMEYDPYARAPSGIPSVDEKPAGVSDEDWRKYRISSSNAVWRGNELQTFDQWKYGFGDVRGRTQDLQEPAIRSLERSVRRSLSGVIENPNVRRQVERATLGGFGMGLEDVSGAARGQALSEYGGDFVRAFETEERNYITELQQTGLENVETLQEARINADRALKTYWQDEQRRYDVEYANWFAQTQEDMANWYAQIAADEQEAGTTTVITVEDG